MTFYWLLLALALAVNIHDWRMAALSFIIGAANFIPVPAPNFYLICALGEALLGLIAYLLAARASKTIVRISVLLIGCHALGYVLNGYPITSPYHILVKISEHAELLACILLSGPFIKRFSHGS